MVSSNIKDLILLALVGSAVALPLNAGMTPP